MPSQTRSSARWAARSAADAGVPVEVVEPADRLRLSSTSRIPSVGGLSRRRLGGVGSQVGSVDKEVLPLLIDLVKRVRLGGVDAVVPHPIDK